MDFKRCSLLFSVYIPILLFSFATIALANDDRTKLQNYMVFVRSASATNNSATTNNAETWHTSLLLSVCKESGASRLIYSFGTVANGFAAKLTEEEVEEMSKQPWFLRAMLANNRYKLTTTHTPTFLKLSGTHGLWKNKKNEGEGVIIGILDSGVTPGHPSFDDRGMPPPPAKWKGRCDFNATVCNNKLIGAKSFVKAGAEAQNHIPPVDNVGHGTHTASTAAGAFVGNTSINGIPMGLASGAAPRAHIAIYRVGNEDIAELDILKGIEEAVKDGCDVLSLSLGDQSRPFYNDTIAVGAFAAVVKGIFVSTSAGNDGLMPSSLSNEAPWLLTVAASTINRRFVSTVKLGNGLRLDGESLYQPKSWTVKKFPIVYLGTNGNASAGECLDGTLDRKQVSGKIVVCDRIFNPRVESGELVRNAGGVGMILVNSEREKYTTYPDEHLLPTSDVTYSDGEKIKKYIRSAKNPVATFVFRGVVLDDKWSPYIGSFSSRGPNNASNLILKPDITGPGVNIFAALPPKVVHGETMQFGLMSGTSMACPHLSGIAALIKHAHPNWSPAAIKSAIMTTAYVTALNGEPISSEYAPASVLEMGAGHVNPEKALDPGLVYDITPEEYIQYLCGLGYSDDHIEAIIQPLPPVKCAEITAIPQEQLNYPSIAVPPSNGTAVIYRTVTNVGTAGATYSALINVPKGVSATVKPAVLHFSRVNETKKFEIDFKWDKSDKKNKFGDLQWVSIGHVVRSPIALMLDNSTFS